MSPDKTEPKLSHPNVLIESDYCEFLNLIFIWVIEVGTLSDLRSPFMQERYYSNPPSFVGEVGSWAPATESD